MLAAGCQTPAAWNEEEAPQAATVPPNGARATPKLPDSPLGEGQTLHTLARQGSAIY